jgi:signal transduction histidine kinase
MIASVSKARADVDGVAAAVLGLTPAAWNAGDAKPVLQEARESVRDARAALREAMKAARAVLADLR